MKLQALNNNESNNNSESTITTNMIDGRKWKVESGRWKRCGWNLLPATVLQIIDQIFM